MTRLCFSSKKVAQSEKIDSITDLIIKIQRVENKFTKY